MNRILVSITFLLALSMGVLSAAGQNDSTVLPVNTIEDGDGHLVIIPETSDRIICLNSGISVLLGALDKDGSVVGRDANSTFPFSLKTVYAVAPNSSAPNVELILEKEPDLILADNMMPDKVYEQLTGMGIPVAVFRTSDPRCFEKTITAVGILTGTEERALFLLNDVNRRVDELENMVLQAQKVGEAAPRIFFENRKPYSSASRKSGSHYPLESAGGINIAADEPLSSPKLSVEFVMEKDPLVIVRRLSGDGTDEVMDNMRHTIMMRTGLDETSAVRNGRVYIIKSDLTLLLNYPAGIAYMAKWFYPETLASFDPEAYHHALCDEYFGPEEWTRLREKFVYPR